MAVATDTPIVISRQEAKAAGLTQFFTGVPCKHGHFSPREVYDKRCVECTRIRKAAYFQKNKDRVLASNKAWVVKNKDKVHAYTMKWRKANEERYLAAQEAWKTNNPDYQEVWRKANLEMVRARGQRRRARKKGALGSFTKEDIQRIHKQQRHKCAVCRTSIKDAYEIDHIVAIAVGGTNWPKNLQLLCMPCNRSKGKKDPIEFMRERGMLL